MATNLGDEEAKRSASIPPEIPDDGGDGSRGGAGGVVAADSAERASDSSHGYRAPQRAIYTDTDLAAFLKSNTHKQIVHFVTMLNDAARGKKISDVTDVPAVLAAIIAEFAAMKAWVDETPPEQQPMRFGNKAFRTWHARVAAKSETFIRGLLPEQHAAAWIELRPYWLDCFGHPTRIDYGTGHETSFILFLLCLSKLDVIDKPDLPAVVLRVFEQYLRLCRKLQTTYWLEPAGSHGVWSLDDYQMLPFVFGSSQLATREDLKPSCIHDDDVMEELGAENLYLQSIGFIKSVKHGGPFAEHSPMLNDISGVPNWSKVNSGMLKMYQGEVLAKRPVVQHFVFGTLLPCTWTPTKPAPRPERTVPFGVAVGPTAGVPMGVAPWAAAASTTGPATVAPRGPAHVSAAAPAPPGGPGGVSMGVAPWSRAPAAASADTRETTDRHE